jgi:hypothetical protein
MRIKSNYKDYYDHVAHIHGGGDPKLVYARVPIDLERCVVRLTYPQFVDLNMSRLWYPDNFVPYNYNSKYIVIAGRRYLVVRKWATGSLMPTDFKLFTEKNFPEEYEHARKSRGRMSSYYAKLSEEIGGEATILTDIARIIGSPVYCVDRIQRGYKDIEVHIDPNIPILANYEIPTIISPEQLYQDLSYYVANTMHPSPDLIVNDNQTDKEKIAGHGFDLKQSFRHRK